MQHILKTTALITMMIFSTGSLALAGAERDAAKKLKSPIYKKSKYASPEIVAEGKNIFEGKGTCFNCHGKTG